MSKLVKVVACASLLAAPAAMAGVTGNAGAVSTYMFRGIDQSLGAAIQGGVDYSHGSGLYAGTWVSTTDAAFAGSTYETDFYGGWTGQGFDVGAIVYHYRDTGANDFVEGYAGWSGSGVAAKVYFSPEFAFTEDSAIYGTVSYSHALSDTLTLTPQVGLSTGDGIETILVTEDSYVDYSVTLAKTLKDGFVFSLAYVANTLDEEDFGAAGLAEPGQMVVGLKKSFDL